MSKMTYAEKLARPEWQKKRLEIMERDGFRCRTCDSAEKTLHVHHRYYISKRMPWEYPSGALVTLCDECHKGDDYDGIGDDGANLFDVLASLDQQALWSAVEIVRNVHEQSRTYGDLLTAMLGLEIRSGSAGFANEQCAAVEAEIRSKASMNIT